MAFIWLVAGLLLFALVLRLANPLPDRANLPTDPMVASISSPLAARMTGLSNGHESLTGIAPLPQGVDAFGMRMALARAATRSIDAQYYMWHSDLSGQMLLAELVAAADRGVAVRILIDDNTTAGQDEMWAAVNSHPNVAVRIFNPMVIRKVRGLNFLFDFPRLNRRMHNKSITFDRTASIVGGRNVGDEYFGVKEEGLFIDLEMLAIGKVVGDITDEFDTYWQSEASYPAERILPEPAEGILQRYRIPTFENAALAADYREASKAVFRDKYLLHENDVFTWADVQVIADDPAKALGKVRREELLTRKIVPLMESAEQRMDLVSAYFVPTDAGADLIAGLAERGVQTRVVTNSVQATDVPLVHAGYSPYRPQLLSSGVDLYEVARQIGDGERRADLAHTRFSGGGSSVHAKTFAIDNRLLFVGSFNFDPRSAYLNCEMGFVIHSPKLALQIGQVLDSRLPEIAYRVTKDDDGNMRWSRQEGGKAVVHETEPGTSSFQRLVIRTMGHFPIEWLL